MARISKAKISADLLGQLKKNGTTGAFYVDLVNDYMSLHDTKNALLKDIKKRGVSVEYNNGGGQTGWKRNDSVGEMVKVNAQMLRLLTEMGIKPTQTGGEDDDL